MYIENDWRYNDAFVNEIKIILSCVKVKAQKSLNNFCICCKNISSFIIISFKLNNLTKNGFKSR